ncbi:oxidoreductase [Marinobacterium nitratireducens]|uniref:Oxidoreductase n=1 Tax=Marinobacterium nitratireducens TaxID=518897 RepID=A0A917ZNM9_9GAMM|nr:aldo/keto reductase [Marinobacterium nitratireducens]GGO85914.1 oxidoreductase [Marinobacterium nitratireducens]
MQIDNPYFSSPGIGLGCMNLSHAYGSPLSQPDAAAALSAAFDMGYRHFDTATLYGGGANETLVGKVLKDKRQQLFLASKCGMAIGQESGKKEIDGRPETLRSQCEASLRRLQTDSIDLYYLHRLDPQVPIEDSVGALSRLVEEGKIGAIGLSEVSAATLTRAQAVHPIAAVQSEYSLWTRNPEIAILDACRESNTALVAFSPLARGYLSATLTDIASLEPKDIRNNMPRFNAEHYPKNLALLDDYVAIARDAGCTPSQLALAWLRSKGDFVVPIPGTRLIDHMHENLEADQVRLETGVIARVEALINQNTVSGPRYSAAQQVEIDTEEFA